MSKDSLNCGASIFNIRAILQNYKENNPPETEFYQVASKDLLTMLEMTHYAWSSLERVESENRNLIEAFVKMIGGLRQ